MSYGIVCSYFTIVIFLVAYYWRVIVLLDLLWFVRSSLMFKVIQYDLKPASPFLTKSIYAFSWKCVITPIWEILSIHSTRIDTVLNYLCSKNNLVINGQYILCSNDQTLAIPLNSHAQILVGMLLQVFG